VTGPLRTELADYLALRRALGYRLARPAKLLVQFLDYLDQAGQSTITVAAGTANLRCRCRGERVSSLNVDR